MEFRKIPPTAPLPAAPPVDPDVQTRETLRLMAKRYLHGARGVLYITGSLMFVISLGDFLTTSGLFGNQAGGVREVFARWSASGPGQAEWLAAVNVLIGLFVISCGWLVLAMPLTATILPAAVLTANVVTALVLTTGGGRTPGVLTAVLQMCLVALTIKAITEAVAFHREAQNLRDLIRSAAILRNRKKDR